MHSLVPRNLPRIYTLAMLAGAVTSGIHVRRAQADEYFDPQALEITADQQQASDLSYFPDKAVSSRDVIVSRLLLTRRSGMSAKLHSLIPGERSHRSSTWRTSRDLG